MTSRLFSSRDSQMPTGKSAGAEPELPSAAPLSSIPLEAVVRVGGLEPESGALHGFGRLWRKVHTISFGSVQASPTEVIRTWRDHFGEFWPDGNRFYAPLGRLQSGEVAVLNLEMPAGTRLATGVLVLYADDEAFTLMTPQGHMFAGWITLSAYREHGETIARAEIVMRATDPIFEIGLELFGHRKENEFWEQTLRKLAGHFSAEREPSTKMTCLDKRRQWRFARNIWHNSAVRSVLRVGLSPISRMGRRARHGQPTSRVDAP
jgi:hypothetical protein